PAPRSTRVPYTTLFRSPTKRPSRRTRKRRSRIFLWFERAVLGLGMSVVAFFIERRLLKALKAGLVKPAPRTAASGEEPQIPLGEDRKSTRLNSSHVAIS